ncbi:fluoride efflux transporter CrcB [Franzmannia qiaohouensis]|uniref:Fluoride-specific ion channel FluC n=1 Tax=Franzmannia qiaohouensis TaxID=1329370 RepID=A0ABU1H8C2_9GAMM|nr:fluoride efflux transporter CrcB [Halomonas qiaohouensis]MDR5903708.1 fluoride efflux transporter CrcB [Halomonas qiaohouensis]
MKAAIANYAAVAAGSALGAMARYLVSLWLLASPGGLPWGTLSVNLLGSIAIGLIASLSAGRWPLSTRMQLFLIGGFCGGFTTFSIFSLEVLTLAGTGAPGMALFYIGLSVALWLAGAWLGSVAGEWLNRRPGR